jgi:hypothetical protein
MEFNKVIPTGVDIDIGQGRKYFFFEKKKQKTFSCTESARVKGVPQRE